MTSNWARSPKNPTSHDLKSPLLRVCCPGFAERDRPGLHHAIWSTPSPLHFLHAILYGWTQPPKNAFCRPPETRTTGTDCLPTLQAGPRYLRGRACPVGGHRCKLSVSPEAGRTRFSGVAPGVASTHTKSHVKSEGGWSAPGCCQNRVVQTVPASLPPKAIWRPKPTLKVATVLYHEAITQAAS